MSKDGIDCSAFTQRMYVNAGNIRLPRTARDQIKVGYSVDWDDLQFGDLVFFHTYSNVFASHVGIYLSDYLFAHSSSNHGVIVSSLKDSYYRKHYIEGRRLTLQDLQRYSINSESKNNTNP
jgi:cell wall-associated NlpC family hydrolase